MVRANSVLESQIFTNNGWSSEGRRSAVSAMLNLIKRAASDQAHSATGHQVLGVVVNWANLHGLVSGESIDYIAMVIARDRSTVIKSLNRLNLSVYCFDYCLKAGRGMNILPQHWTLSFATS